MVQEFPKRLRCSPRAPIAPKLRYQGCFDPASCLRFAGHRRATLQPSRRFCGAPLPDLFLIPLSPRGTLRDTLSRIAAPLARPVSGFGSQTPLTQAYAGSHGARCSHTDSGIFGGYAFRPPCARLPLAQTTAPAPGGSRPPPGFALYRHRSPPIPLGGNARLRPAKGRVGYGLFANTANRPCLFLIRGVPHTPCRFAGRYAPKGRAASYIMHFIQNRP